MQFQPQDMTVWLGFIDVNYLSGDEADRLSSFDLDNADGLKGVIDTWLRPEFEKDNAQNRAEMLEVLEYSKRWTAAQLRPVFRQVGSPSGNEIKDIDRFKDTLRASFLG